MSHGCTRGVYSPYYTDREGREPGMVERELGPTKTKPRLVHSVYRVTDELRRGRSLVLINPS